MEICYQNKIFVANQNQAIAQYGPFRYIDIGLFNENLVKQWELRFGANSGRRFIPFGITATYDQGAIVYGETLTVIGGSNSHFDPFYIKFDCNGQILNTENLNINELLL